jgi:hypothetical protein
MQNRALLATRRTHPTGTFDGPTLALCEDRRGIESKPRPHGRHFPHNRRAECDYRNGFSDINIAFAKVAKLVGPDPPAIG